MSRAAFFVLAIAVGAALAAGGYWFGQRHAQHVAPAAAPATSQADAKTDASGRRILYWHDPMYPQQKFDKPGRSPFMNMDLVPVYADSASEEGGVTVSARVRQSLGMRTAAAQATEFRLQTSAVGYVQADERRIARADVRTSGWVEKLHVRAVNDPVRAQPAVDAPQIRKVPGSVLIAAKEPRSALPLLRRAWTAWKQLDAPYEAARVRAVIARACRDLGELESLRHGLLQARPQERIDPLDVRSHGGRKRPVISRSDSSKYGFGRCRTSNIRSRSRGLPYLCPKLSSCTLSGFRSFLPLNRSTKSLRRS